MAKDDEKTLRQLSLLSFLLEAGRPVTASEIMESVEGYTQMTYQAFRKRLSQDRDNLRDLGIVIEQVQNPLLGTGDAYYLPRDNYELPDIQLAPEEYAILFSSLVLLREHFPLYKPLRLALATLAQAGGMLVPRTLPSHLDRLIVSGGIDDDPDTAERLAASEAALNARKSVRFSYRSAGAEHSEVRTVDPYGLYLISSHWYLVGHDHTRATIRMFRLDRMEGRVTQATRRTHDFTVPASYDAQRYRSRPPWLLGDRQGAALVLVESDLAWWVDRTYGPFSENRRECAEGILFTLPYSDPDPLLAWVVKWRRHARLTDPPELVERLIVGLRHTAALHGKPQSNGKPIEP